MNNKLQIHVMLANASILESAKSSSVRTKILNQVQDDACFGFHSGSGIQCTHCLCSS
ncbi:hypothetical protein AB4304_12565 [Vibrio breoganii]|uniref:hypothetical protein n=1 Tax=Vibrio breoganii TaxID=553239 RepID=UPI0018E44FC8|nr:hypothetical protein [Vibrio breoganii]